MLGHSVPHVERVEIDPEKIAAFKVEAEFTSLAVSLMVEAASYCCIAASALGPEATLDREHAAVAGNMVRQYKLLDAFLDQVCKRRDETAMIIARLVFEAAVNIKFLIKNFSKELVQDYILYSLRHERALKNLIHKNIAERDGVSIAIEGRMLRSIERAERASGLNLEESDVNGRRPWGGKNIFQKARDVDLEGLYLAAFGGGSHSVHGNWQDLYANHLEWDGAEGFTPKLTWRNPRPQMVTSLSLVVTDTLKEYFDFIGGSEISEYYSPLLDDLLERVLFLVEAHENYLSEKQWPSI